MAVSEDPADGKSLKLCVKYARKPSHMLLTYQAIKMTPSPPHHATCISWACMMENMSMLGLQMQVGMGHAKHA